MKLDPATLPVLRIEFTMPDGSLLTREWTMAQAASDPLVEKLKEIPPTWLENPRRAWDRPQDPITFTGTVKPGHENDARALLGLDV